MQNWKYFGIFIVLVAGFTPCSATNSQCFWVLDAVEKENPSQTTPTIVPGGQYLLRIRVKCDDMVRIFVVKLSYFKLMLLADSASL